MEFYKMVTRNFVMSHLDLLNELNKFGNFKILNVTHIYSDNRHKTASEITQLFKRNALKKIETNDKTATYSLTSICKQYLKEYNK